MSLRQSFKATAGPSRLPTVHSHHLHFRRLLHIIPTHNSSSIEYLSPRDEHEDAHLNTLLLNRELSSSEASDELRWIRAQVRSRAQNSLARGKLPPIEEESVSEMVARRSRGEPLQYILGNTDFGPLTLLCRKPVLIPRPETAHIFTLLAEHIKSALFSSASSSSSSSSAPTLPLQPKESLSLSILDLCTGSGCIPLLLSHLLSHDLSLELTMTGIDNSPAAIALASANIQSLKMDHAVKVRYGNIFASPSSFLLPVVAEGEGRALKTKTTGIARNRNDHAINSTSKKVDMIVSNPPYIPWKEYLTLPDSVRKYESPSALLGDPSLGSVVKETGRGLWFYERIAEILPDCLSSEEEIRTKRSVGLPRVALEVGHNQAASVEEILKKGGMIRRTEVWDDQYGVPRMVVGWT